MGYDVSNRNMREAIELLVNTLAKRHHLSPERQQEICDNVMNAINKAYPDRIPEELLTDTLEQKKLLKLIVNEALRQTHPELLKVLPTTDELAKSLALKPGQEGQKEELKNKLDRQLDAGLKLLMIPGGPGKALTPEMRALSISVFLEDLKNTPTPEPKVKLNREKFQEVTNNIINQDDEEFMDLYGLTKGGMALPYAGLLSVMNVPIPPGYIDYGAAGGKLGREEKQVWAHDEMLKEFKLGTDWMVHKTPTLTPGETE